MMRRRGYSEEGRPIDPGGSGSGGIGPGGVPRARAFGGPGAAGAPRQAPAAGDRIDARLAGIINELRQVAASLGNVADARQALSEAAVQINRARAAARRSGRS
jgi:hypothetical protein